MFIFFLASKLDQGIKLVVSKFQMFKWCNEKKARDINKKVGSKKSWVFR